MFKSSIKSSIYKVKIQQPKIIWWQKSKENVCGNATHWCPYFQSDLQTRPVSFSGESLTQCDVDSSRCCSLPPRTNTRRSPSCKVAAEITTCRPPWPRRSESGLSSGRHRGPSPLPGTLCCSDRVAERPSRRIKPLRNFFQTPVIHYVIIWGTFSFALCFCQNCYRLVGLHRLLRGFCFFILLLLNAATSFFFFFTHTRMCVWGLLAQFYFFDKRWKNKQIFLLVPSSNPYMMHVMFSQCFLTNDTYCHQTELPVTECVY